MAPYADGDNKWASIPYGSATWTESGARAQVLDVYKPATAAPAGGYPVILWFHPNGATHVMTPGSDIDNARIEALAAGFAFISCDFRHPVTNVSEGAPHQDVGRAIQMARALANAFQLSKTNVFALAQSRGSLALWQGMQANLADNQASTWEGRQSSYLKGIWAFNPQTTYNTEQMASLFVTAGAEQAEFLAAFPNDARWGSAITDVATAPNLPAVALLAENAYWLTPQNAETVGADTHYPDFCRTLREAYVARGSRPMVADLDLHGTGGRFTGAVDWCRAIIDGADAKEAMAIAIAKMHSGSLYYVKPDRANVFTDLAGTTKAPVGGIIANIGNAGVGGAATQSDSLDGPILVASGIYHAIDFADASDNLQTTKGTANTGTVVVSAKTDSNTPPAAVMGNATNSGGVPGFGLRAQSSTQFQLRVYNTSTTNTATATVANAQDPAVVEGWWTGSNVFCAVNGAAAGSASQTGNPTNAQGAIIGRQNPLGTGQPWKGRVFLTFQCDGALTDRKRRAVARFGAQLQGIAYSDN